MGCNHSRICTLVCQELRSSLEYQFMPWNHKVVPGFSSFILRVDIKHAPNMVPSFPGSRNSLADLEPHLGWGISWHLATIGMQHQLAYQVSIILLQKILVEKCWEEVFTDFHWPEGHQNNIKIHQMCLSYCSSDAQSLASWGILGPLRWRNRRGLVQGAGLNRQAWPRPVVEPSAADPRAQPRGPEPSPGDAWTGTPLETQQKGLDWSNRTVEIYVEIYVEICVEICVKMMRWNRLDIYFKCLLMSVDLFTCWLWNLRSAMLWLGLDMCKLWVAKSCVIPGWCGQSVYPANWKAKFSSRSPYSTVPTSLTWHQTLL